MICFTGIVQDIDGLVQDCSISIANALEILQSWTKPSIAVVTCVWKKIENYTHEITVRDQSVNTLNYKSLLASGGIEDGHFDSLFKAFSGNNAVNMKTVFFQYKVAIWPE